MRHKLVRKHIFFLSESMELHMYIAGMQMADRLNRNLDMQELHNNNLRHRKLVRRNISLVFELMVQRMYILKTEKVANQSHKLGIREV